MNDSQEAGVHSWTELDGQLLRVRLARPPTNVLGMDVIEGLRQAFAEPAPRTVAAILDAEGPDFSFGASVKDHLPGAIEQALPQFHDLFRQLAGFPVPLLVVVRGRCLGGGLELAAWGDVLFAGPNALFGAPEIRLGVFAPLASLILRERVGEGAARDMLLSGRSIPAAEAKVMGLVQSLSSEPEVAAMAWVRENALPLSPSSLRVATRAARMMFLRRVLPAIDAVEGLYLGELMSLPDAEEGLRAFLEKRKPRWRTDP